MLCDDTNDNTTYSGLNWAYHIKTLLQSISLKNVWYEQNANNANFQNIKQRIYQCRETFTSSISPLTITSILILLKHTSNFAFSICIFIILNFFHHHFYLLPKKVCSASASLRVS